MEKATLMDYVRNSSKTKLFLAVDTSLFRELLSELFSDEMDLEVVGQSSDSTSDPIELLAKVGESSADVVVLSWPQGGEMPEICTHLFAEYPGLEVIGISPDGGSVFNCRQVISITRRTSSSVDQMLQAIRGSRAGSSLSISSGSAPSGLAQVNGSPFHFRSTSRT